MNVSGIAVKTRPEHLQQVLADLESSEHCDLHFHDELGQIIVTIEGENVSEEIRKLKLVQQIPNIISADMVYSYCGEETERDMATMAQYLEREGAVPQFLNREDVDAESISYGGDWRNLSPEVR